MKILYFSDRYADGVMGTKRSLRLEMIKRGHKVFLHGKAQVGAVLQLTERYSPDQVWLVHSGLRLPGRAKESLKIPVVGFGFSDPYNFTEARLRSYDIYITNHYKTFLDLNLKGVMPVFYNPTACDLSFHKELNLSKDIDISYIGIGRHPQFKNTSLRMQTISRLRKDTNFSIQIYGRNWPMGAGNHPHIQGQKFLEVISRSKIGLDIQEDWCPLAHRMFEYSACGTPVITRKCEEVERHLRPPEEVLVYDSYEDLKQKVLFYLRKPEELGRIGRNARERCVREHDIRHRVNGILDFLRKVFIIRRKLW